MTQGQNVAFSVAAGGTSPFSYQWYFDGSALGGGSQSSTYALNNVNTGNAGSYTVVVTNAGGSVTSLVATLAVYVPPQIQGLPGNLTVTQGQTASFSVTVNSGTAPFSYQWNFDGAALLGATNAGLTLTNVQTTQAGSYTVVVTNLGGSVTSGVETLTVNVPATITTQPQSQTALRGQSASFSVGAAGTANLSYQWYFNGSSLGGAGNTSTLTFNSVVANNAGQYTVVVKNNYGSATSTVATLTVLLPHLVLTPAAASAGGIAANGFAFQFTRPAGSTYVILASTDLLNWTPISTNVASGGSILFTDSAATNYPGRFYRVMVP